MVWVDSLTMADFLVALHCRSVLAQRGRHSTHDSPQEQMTFKDAKPQPKNRFWYHGMTLNPF